VEDQKITLKLLKKGLKPLKIKQFQSLKISKVKVTASKLMLLKAEIKFIKN